MSKHVALKLFNTVDNMNRRCHWTYLPSHCVQKLLPSKHFVAEGHTLQKKRKIPWIIRAEKSAKRNLSLFAMNWEGKCSKWPTFNSGYSHSTVRICECFVSTDRFRNPRPYQHANVWRPRWRLKDAAPPSVSASNEHLFDRTHLLVTRRWGAEHHLQWEAEQVNRQRKEQR